MSDDEHTAHGADRRRLLKILVATPLAFSATSLLPSEWLPAELELGVLPAHADGSDVVITPFHAEMAHYRYFYVQGREPTVDNPVTGLMGFRDDGTFDQDGDNPETGHYLSGGTWTIAGGALSIHFTWYEYDGEDRVDYDGSTMTGPWDTDAALTTLEDSHGWVIEIDTP
jgi:hypothetical protein